MKLYIDTSSGDEITIGLNEKMYSTQARDRSSQKLLLFIKDTLETLKVNLSEISEIEVNIGPGSFTGLRVGLAVANTLGWSLNIPVNGRNIKKQGPILPKYNLPA